MRHPDIDQIAILVSGEMDMGWHWMAYPYRWDRLTIQRLNHVNLERAMALFEKQEDLEEEPMAEEKEMYEVTAEVTIISKKFSLSRETRGRMLGISRRNGFIATILLNKEELYHALYETEASPNADLPLLMLEGKGVREYPQYPKLDLTTLLDDDQG